MPSMANITLKNAAGTDVTATAMTPSAGDSVPARWRIETSDAPAFRPSMSAVARQSGTSADVRRVQLTLASPAPYENTATGLTASAGTIRFSGEFIVPQSLNSAAVDDTVAYVQSFLNSTLIKSVLANQIAPT